MSSSKFLVPVRLLDYNKLSDVLQIIYSFSREIESDKYLKNYKGKFINPRQTSKDVRRDELDEFVADFLDNYYTFKKELSDKAYEDTGKRKFKLSQDYVSKRAGEYSKWGVLESLQREMGIKALRINTSTGEVMFTNNPISEFRVLIKAGDTEYMYRSLTDKELKILTVKPKQDEKYIDIVRKNFVSPESGAFSQEALFVANIMDTFAKHGYVRFLNQYGKTFTAETLVRAYESWRSEYSDVNSRNPEEGLIRYLFDYSYNKDNTKEIEDFILRGLSEEQGLEFLEGLYPSEITDEPEDFEIGEAIDIDTITPKIDKKAKAKERRKAKPRKSKGARRAERNRKAAERRARSEQVK